jgi:hypothetical protein
MMQPGRILIYGDSNVWGDKGFGENGAPLGRYAAKQQWPNILQRLLGDEYDIIQAGLCGRTAGEYAEQPPYLGGKIGYEIALREASPVEGVIIALGVNDVSHKRASDEQIVADLQWYSTYTRAYAADSENDMVSSGNVWYIAPVQRYKPLASKLHCIDEKLRTTHATISNPLDDNDDYAPDGIHFSLQGHRRVAQAVYDAIKQTENNSHKYIATQTKQGGNV